MKRLIGSLVGFVLCWSAVGYFHQYKTLEGWRFLWLVRGAE